MGYRHTIPFELIKTDNQYNISNIQYKSISINKSIDKAKLKKKTCFSSLPASLFSAASLFFIIFYEQCFYEQKPTGVTVHTKIMEIFTVNPFVCIKIKQTCV